MADKEKASSISREQALDIEKVQRRLEMLDQRLDNIDSVVTAVVERVMKQLVTLSIDCPNCGKRIEIALVASEKPTR